MNNNPGRGIRSSMKSPCSIARKKYGLVKVQAKLCRNSMDAMPHVQIAATLAVETCKNIFGYHKWNCSSVDMAPTLTPDLTRGKIVLIVLIYSSKQNHDSFIQFLYTTKIHNFLN